MCGGLLFGRGQIWVVGMLRWVWVFGDGVGDIGGKAKFFNG